MNHLKPFVLLSVAALSYTLGYPNIFSVYLPIMPILATAILVHMLFKAKRLKTKLIYYFFYNAVITALSFYWITKTLQEFGALPFVVAAISNIFFAFILNPHVIILIFTITAIELYFPRIQKSFFKSGLFTFILAALMTSLEYYVPQQFPIMLGQPWIIFSEYLGFASYMGLPVFSFFSYLLAFECVKAYQQKSLSYINIFSILIFVFVNPFLIPKNLYEKTHKLNVRAVQANISNFLKVDSESGAYASVEEVIDRYQKLSTMSFKDNEDVDLIIWPETAYPFPLYTNKRDITKTLTPSFFSSITSQMNSSLFIGGYDHYKSNEDGSHFQTEYNAGLFIDRNAKLQNVYHKHILIPFGETLPLGPFTKWASQHVSEMAFFAQGKTYPLFELENGTRFISSICYEILKPEFVRDYLNHSQKRAHLMINLTNDSWYGNTVEPEQHLFLARWRAIEFNLPILRSTNTGITTLIQANGKEKSRLEYNYTGNLDLKLDLPVFTESDNRTQTIYQKYGFLAILPLWLLYFIFHLILINLFHDK